MTCWLSSRDRCQHHTYSSHAEMQLTTYRYLPGSLHCKSTPVVPTLMSAKGMRMPDSSMQMLWALRCSTREMAALRVVASFLKAVFSRICTTDFMRAVSMHQQQHILATVSAVSADSMTNWQAMASSLAMRYADLGSGSGPRVWQQSQ